MKYFSCRVLLLASLSMAIFLPATSQEVIEGSWTMQASSFRKQTGKQITIQFPAGGTLSNRIWGTDLYTDDSSVGTAAVHAGLITVKEGGTVTIEMRPGAQEYEGTLRNGVTSKTWGPFPGSFVFVESYTSAPRIESESLTLRGNWGMTAELLRGENGRQFTISFPPGGTLSEYVWGKGTYTDHSNIASAAVHAGLITPEKGGTVTVEIRPGQDYYEGSYANEVYSRDYEAFEGSFVFVEKKKEKPWKSQVIQEDVIQGTWTMHAGSFRKSQGKRFTISFPENGKLSDRLWGTDLYTDDSSIAAAAVHAGIITPREGGTVTIEIKPGAQAYEGSSRNGVTSKSWGPFPGSFVFVAENR
ncbi:MAG TPA: LCCL domain-containing protein [Prolixibacteraceae bacterium]|nr:LCCL domain-containing protein [Prolixibacteraceae bacterium]